MKILKGKNQIKLVEDFSKIKNKLEKLKKEEKKLKEDILSMANGEAILKTDQLELNITDVISFKIDTAAIKEEMGEKWVEKYQKEYVYTKINIKSA